MAAVSELVAAIADPWAGRPLGELGLLDACEVDGRTLTVHVRLPSTTMQPALVQEAIARGLPANAALDDVQVVSIPMDEHERVAFTELLTRLNPTVRPQSRLSVIGIASGKGGVGKSTVSANLAVALESLGHRVGLIDADIWGYSAPRLLGLERASVCGIDTRLLFPVRVRGLRVMSMGFVSAGEDRPVIARGPILHKLLEVFVRQVWWGEVSHLVVDLPPGTGDVAISLNEFMGSCGYVIVTTPEGLAERVAERAARMAERMNQRILGVVENMAGDVFGEGGGQHLAARLTVPHLATIPLTADLRKAGERGTPLVWSAPDHPVSRQFIALARRLSQHRPPRRLPVR